MLATAILGLSDQPAAQASSCTELMPSQNNAAVMEFCSGEDEARQADISRSQPDEQERRFRIAAAHYRRAVALATTNYVKKRALLALAEAR